MECSVQRAQGAEEGPRAELRAWTARLSWLGRLVERLRRDDARMVLALAGAARSRALPQWREWDLKVRTGCCV